MCERLLKTLERMALKAARKVHLIGICDVPGMLAGEIEVGDIESRNYSYRIYRVISIDRKTKAFIFYTVEDLKTGEKWPVKRKKNSLAPVERLES